MNISTAPTPAQTASSPKLTTEQRARQTATDFESVFVNQMLSLMEPDMEDDAFYAGAAEDQFRAFLNDNIATEIANSGGVGLADKVYDQLMKLQEAQ